MDNLCDFDSAVVVGNGNCLYDGRPDPYSAGNRHYRGAGTHHPGAENPLGNEILPGTASFNKEGRTAIAVRPFLITRQRIPSDLL